MDEIRQARCSSGEAVVLTIAITLKDGEVAGVTANSTGIGHADIRVEAASDRIEDEGILWQLRRIADHFDPPAPNIVGTPYVAQKLDCTTVWVTQMIHLEQIPASCIVPGTGNGKPWKFYRRQIDEWIKRR